MTYYSTIKLYINGITGELSREKKEGYSWHCLLVPEYKNFVVKLCKFDKILCWRIYKSYKYKGEMLTKYINGILVPDNLYPFTLSNALKNQLTIHKHV